MFSRYVLAVFCIIAIFAFVNVRAEEVVQSNESEDGARANPLVKTLAKALGKMFAGASAACAFDAANTCKHKLKHWNEAIQCGKDYFKQNKGRCAVGK